MAKPRKTVAKLKTKPGKHSVRDFLKRIPDEATRRDCLTIAGIMKKATGDEPRMWGSSIVGFGTYHYKYSSGREGDWFTTGFSPRKQNLTLYIMAGFDRYDALMKKLGRYKTGKSCLYIRSLADVDTKVLTRLIQESVQHVRRAH